MAIGEHVGNLAFLFSSVKVDCRPVSIKEELKQQIRREVPEILRHYSSFQTGRTMGWTSAAGISEMVSVIRQDAEKIMPCSAVLDGEYGYKGFSMGVPAILGKDGIQQILELKFTEEEKEALERAASSLKTTAKVVNQFVTQSA